MFRSSWNESIGWVLFDYPKLVTATKETEAETFLIAAAL
jgi:hypothetical protein